VDSIRWPTVALLVLGFATTAQAANQLYVGSLIIESFGNDAAGAFYGIPFGLHCNSLYGTTTWVSSPPASCTPVERMQGAPLTGSGIVGLTESGPAGFRIKAAASSLGGLRRTATGSFPYHPRYIYSYTYATLENRAGRFSSGGGPGDFSLPYKVGATTVAKVIIKAGPNQFGGVMRLLGSMRTRWGYYRSCPELSCVPFSGISYGTIDWRYDLVGATAMTVGGIVTGPYIGTATGTVMYSGLDVTATLVAKATRFPWTTGTVTVTATRPGLGDTVLARRGYDNRTPLGKGTIQLVSPLLTHWLQPGLSKETGGIGILRLQFIPEPEPLLLLLVALCGLGILSRIRTRGAR
jgi:hypothetical protein